MQVKKKERMEGISKEKRIKVILKAIYQTITGKREDKNTPEPVNETIIYCRKSEDIPDAYNYLRKKFIEWKVSEDITYEQIEKKHKINAGQLNSFITDIKNEREPDYRNYILEWLKKTLNISLLSILKIKNSERDSIQLLRENAKLRQEIDIIKKSKIESESRILAKYYKLRGIINERSPELAVMIEGLI